MLTMKSALRSHAFDSLAQLADSGAQSPPIEFELLLAGSPGADPAPEPGKQRPASPEARQQIIELRKFDLKLAFAAARPPREDVEDELGPVDHLEPERGFEVAELSGREVVVEDDAIRARTVRQSLDFCDFSASEERRRIGVWRVLEGGAEHLAAGARSELGKLLQRFFVAMGPCPRQSGSPTRRPGGQVHLLERIAGTNRINPLQTKRLLPPPPA